MIKPPVVTLLLPGATPRLAVAKAKPLPAEACRQVAGGRAVDSKVEALLQLLVRVDGPKE